MDKKGKGGLEEIRKDLKNIKETQKHILAYMDGDIIKKGAEYERISALLAPLQFSVASIAKTHDDKGNVKLIINYARPSSSILITEDDVIWDSFAAAMNELNLISYEDMEKIAEAIESSTNK